MAVKIIADSPCDLPQEIIKKYDIELLSFKVYEGETEYLDGDTISPREVLEGIREGKHFKTAQITPATFQNVFSHFADQGQDCIYIAFSSELSGTYQSAEVVKRQLTTDNPEFNLEVIDTKCASIGLGLVVYFAARMAAEGRSMEEIIEAVHYYSRHMEHIFTVDDLEYLRRGGRISRASAFVGGILNIKPILNVEDGKLIPIKKVRGRKKAIASLLDYMSERGNKLSLQTVGICHGDVPKRAQLLKERIEEKFGCQDFVINTIGGTIGAHAGPGTLSVFFLNKYREYLQTTENHGGK